MADEVVYLLSLLPISCGEVELIIQKLLDGLHTLVSSVYNVHLSSHVLYLTRIPLVKVLQLERVVTHMGLFRCEAESLSNFLPVHVQLRGSLLQELLAVNDDLSDALEFLLEYLFHLLLDELLKLAFLQKRLFVYVLL